ncbi:MULTISPECIES: RNA-guided endonuclease InsQ/TnpB family protein [unclassified Brevundimonas]
MAVHKAFRFRLYPRPEQAETLGQWIGVTRLVYNLALEQRRDFWRQYKASRGKNLSWGQQSLEVTALRREFDFIAAVPRTCLEYALRDLDKAFEGFFRGGGYPFFRKKGVNASIRLAWKDLAKRTINGRWAEVRLPRIGWVRYRKSREIAGNIMNVTVLNAGGRWDIVFSADVQDVSLGLTAVVGIDRGIATTLSLSTGEHIRLPDIGAMEKRRRRAQRILARRKRGSARYRKQRHAVARIASKIARVRSHHLHVASTSLAARFGVVVLEDLNVRAMTASAKGTVEKPGRRVAQKRGLNRSILAQGWSIFASQLEYKMRAAGGRLVYVPAAYTSQTCAECGVVDARSRKSQAVFECIACGHGDHADTNAARNIMRGSTAFVEEGHLGPPCEARTAAA